MLERIIELTNEYIESMPKKERKKYGQFFTSMETARFMVGLYHIDEKKSKVSVLDAGAGSGILSCAFIERLETIDSVQKIELTCYENDNNVLPLLKRNLEYCKEKSGKKIVINIIEDNYILNQYLDFNHMIGGNDNPKKYDFVIGNPPYMKIPKDAPEATAMPEVCYGAPNLYFIFASMGLFNLCEEGELVYIIPRSWTSGAYFKRFREYFLTVGKLEHIHLFVSRSKVFDKESVLQETIIIKGNMRPMFDELSSVFENDYVARKLYGTDFYSLFYNKNDKGEYNRDCAQLNKDPGSEISLKIIRKTLLFLIDDMEIEDKYLNTLKVEIEQLLQKTILNIKDSERLSNLSRLLLTELINRGYSQEYIYAQIKERYYSCENEIKDVSEEINLFWEMFSFKECKYNVVLPIKRADIKKLLDHFQNITVIWFADPVDFQNPIIYM